MITLRTANATDTPTLAAMMHDHAHIYLDDYHEVSNDLAGLLIASGDVIAYDWYGLAIGFAWFSDKHPDKLHASVHILIEPRHYRQVKKLDLVAKMLDRAFAVYDVGKIKAQCMHTQTSAMKLLKAHKFKQIALNRNETKKGGKKVDVFGFELHRKFWTRNRLRELETVN